MLGSACLGLKWLSMREVINVCGVHQSTLYAATKRDAIDDAHIYYEDFLLQKSWKIWSSEVIRRHKLQAASRDFFTGVLVGSKRKTFCGWRKEVEFSLAKKDRASWQVLDVQCLINVWASGLYFIACRVSECL